MSSFRIRAGDTLNPIAALAKTSQPNAIRAAAIPQPSSSFVSARPAAPVRAVKPAAKPTAAASAMTYRVRPGDTVTSISKKLHLTRSELGAFNDLSKPLKAGQVLKLAARADHPASRTPPKRTGTRHALRTC